VQQYRGKCWRRISTHLPGKTEVRMQNDHASSSSSFMHLCPFFFFNRLLFPSSPSYSPFLVLSLCAPSLSLPHTPLCLPFHLFFLYDFSSQVQCLHRWSKVLHPDLKKGPWTDEVRQTQRYIYTQKDTYIYTHADTCTYMYVLTHTRT
jgi:hypothetical protein